MTFETAADAFIRPPVRPAATPAHSAAAAQAANGRTAAASALQAAWLSDGAAGERGAKADHETAAGEFSFYDLLDVINPMQHIPGLASVYRAVTGDEIKAPAQVLGGLLFGGGIGLVAAAANAVIKESSGRDIGEAAVAALFGDEAAPANMATVPAEATEAALAAQLQPAAGAQAAKGNAGGAAYAPVPGSTRSLAAETPAATPADQAMDEAAAVSAAMTAPAGATLTGEAALNAFLNDMAALGRQAAGPDAEDATLTVAGNEPAAAQAAGESRPLGERGNLAGLGSRDSRPSAPKAPALVVPAARLTNTQQPAAAQEPGRNAPRINSGAAPRLSGAATLDPTLFATEPSSETSAPSTAAPPPDSAVPNDFSEQMMRALQKYETMLDD
ncbi:MAG: hypothetical protein ACFCUQ_04550 [Kiloniellales bacterium]